jgi:pilus assembly protein TadC
MTSGQQYTLDNLMNMQRNLGQSWMSYWQTYSNVTTWQFWVNLVLFVAPLIILYFYIDRSRIFRIGFFGFNVHVWFGYIDLLGGALGLWAYPYKILPFFTISVSLEAALVPVAYMLLYQWALERKRNYYLYATILSAILAFGLKPAMAALSLFKMYQWMNYFYLFLGYIVIMLLSKWITDVFAYLHNRQGGVNRGGPSAVDDSQSSTTRRWRPKGPSRV